MASFVNQPEQPAPAPFEPPGGADGGDDEPIFDYQFLRELLGFVVRSVRRHLALAIVSGLVVFGCAASTLKVLPRTWHVEAKLLAQRNSVINSLGNPSRSIGDDAPTRAAQETVMRHDNLVSLIKQTGLIDNWANTRAPLLKLVDSIGTLIRGPRTDDEKVDALVGVLQKKLTVETGEGTVTILIDWTDAQMAYQLVETAQQNFLEARHVSEISAIAEAISILEGHAAEVRESINQIVEEMQRYEQRQAKGGPTAAPLRKRPGPSEQELAQLKVMLAAKRRAINDLDDFRRHRLAELQTQLTQQKAVFAESHPAVMNIQQSIDALSMESPQIQNLRREEQEMVGEYVRRGGKAADVSADAPEQMASGLPSETLTAVRREPARDASPELEFARSRLRFAINKYDSLLDRIEAARIELDAARAAFKYRYSVILPAQVPKDPTKPKPVMVLVGGLLAGLMMAFLSAALIDWRSGRVLERWQAERLLGIPVLGEVRSK